MHRGFEHVTAMLLGRSDVAVICDVSYDLYVVGQHGVLCEIRGEDLSRYSNQIE